jgi:DNA-directed RNA polymerase specialized sigma24 family protein
MIAEPSSCASPSDNPELPPALLRSISYRASRLARAFRLGVHDREDLAQTLALKIVGARARHPEAGRSIAFLRSVLDLAYIDIARSLRRRGGTREFALFHPETVPAPFTPHLGGWAHEADRRMDLEAAVVSLPSDLGELAGLLGGMTVREAAERLGCHRGTAYRRVASIRSAFEEFFAEDGIPRDTGGPATERSCGTGRAERPAHGARRMPDPPPPPAQRCPAPAPQGDRGRS